MAKGFFTQTFVVLLNSPIQLSELEPLLHKFKILKHAEASEYWEMGGPTLIIEFKPERNGLVALDVVHKQWPDHMGNPETEPHLFMAWGTGQFGPYAFPGGLERATQQAWTWPEAKELVPTHQGFVRLRLSYIFGADNDSPMLPPDYSAQPELEFLTDLALELLEHPAALAYFNPNGEVVTQREPMMESVQYHRKNKLPSFAVWANVRLLNIGDEPGWMMMDTVGNQQLDMPDHEFIFREGEFDPGEVDFFLRNVSLYILQKGQVIKHGDTINGPKNVKMQARKLETTQTQPPRAVYRWISKNAKNVPESLLGGEPLPNTSDQKPWWKFW